MILCTKVRGAPFQAAGLTAHPEIMSHGNMYSSGSCCNSSECKAATHYRHNAQESIMYSSIKVDNLLARLAGQQIPCLCHAI